MDIKLLKKEFNISEIKHVPDYLAPYSFVISMPHKLTLITPSEEVENMEHTELATCSCFVVEEESAGAVMKATSSIVEILNNNKIDSNVMLLGSSSYIFVGTNDAMNAVMLLSSLGYDIKYSDFY